MPTVDQGTLKVSPSRLSQNEDTDSSADSTRENSIYMRNFRNAVQPESQQVQSSSADLPHSNDLRPRLPPQDYHEKVIQNKILSETGCISIVEPVAQSDPLTQSQKRDAIIDSCQRTRILPSSSEILNDPNVDNTYTHFKHSAQSTPSGYLERRMEIRQRYSLKDLQKRLSSKKGVNAVIDSCIHPKFCFSKFLTAPKCRAHCVSSVFAMVKGLASTLACGYLESQQLRKLSFNLFPPGFLVAYLDQQNIRYLSHSVTKRRCLQKPTYETLELSLKVLKQHLKRPNVEELAIPKLGCGYIGCGRSITMANSFFDFFQCFLGFKTYYNNISTYMKTWHATLAVAVFSGRSC